MLQCSIVYPKSWFVHKIHRTRSRQGVEKNNDDVKRILFQKSNKWDAAKNILFVESRQWDLMEHERKKGNYIKRNHEYWDVDINQNRKKRKPLTEAPILHDEYVNSDVTTGSVNYRSFTVTQLRKARDYSTRTFKTEEKCTYISS